MDSGRNMSIVNLPIITSVSINEIKEIFNQTYLDGSLKFEGFPLKVFPEDFEHICFENDDGDFYKKKFSLRRARKMLAIKELCKRKIPYILIHQIHREHPTVCVLAESIELALFLIPKVSKEGKYLRIGTIISYGKNVETKIEKQKANGVMILKIEEAF